VRFFFPWESDRDEEREKGKDRGWWRMMSFKTKDVITDPLLRRGKGVMVSTKGKGYDAQLVEPGSKHAQRVDESMCIEEQISRSGNQQINVFLFQTLFPTNTTETPPNTTFPLPQPKQPQFQLSHPKKISNHGFL
jgi:hypothetical protein